MHDVADSDCGLEKKPVGHAAAIEPGLPKKPALAVQLYADEDKDFDMVLVGHGTGLADA